MTNEAFARIKIDKQLTDVGWKIDDGHSVKYEHPLKDGKRIDYVLNDRLGRPLALIEAKKFHSGLPLETAKDQARHYADQLGVDFIFLANGNEVKFWDYKHEAHPHDVKTIFDQDNLERRAASRKNRRDIMTVEIDGKIAGGQGRDYQVNAINAICEGVKKGRNKFLLEMATGTGKTRTAAALIKRLFESGYATRVLFLVDRITLAKQTDDEFQDMLHGYSSYVFKNGKFHNQNQICVTTLQSMIGSYHKYSSGYFDLVIVDECHRSIYGKWRCILDHFDGIKVGLTATPCVAREVDNTEDEDERAFIKDTLRFFELQEPTFRYTMRDAIQDRHLVPYHIYKAKTVRTAQEGSFEVQRNELNWNSMDTETRTELETLFQGGNTISVDPKALERRFTIPQRNQAIVREFRNVIENGYTSPSGEIRRPQDGKTIVFAVSKRHAATLAKLFDDAFADKKPTPNTAYADFVVSNLSGEGEGSSEAIIKRFKREEFPKIIVSVNMLDTGFDCPEVVNLVFARYTESAVLYRQMRGRGTRKAPHIKKTMFTMFDFVGVTDFHGDNEEFPEGGAIIAAKPSDSETTRPRNVLMLDIFDDIDPLTREWVTTDEDGNIVRNTGLEARQNELTAKFEGWYTSYESKLEDEEQRRLVRRIGDYIIANAAHMTKDGFTMAHFAMPPFRNDGGRIYALSILGNEEKLNRIIQKMNEVVFSEDFDTDDTRQMAGTHSSAPNN